MLTEQQLELVNSVQAKLADAKAALRDLSNQAGVLKVENRIGSQQNITVHVF